MNGPDRAVDCQDSLVKAGKQFGGIGGIAGRSLRGLFVNKTDGLYTTDVYGQRLCKITISIKNIC